MEDDGLGVLEKGLFDRLKIRPGENKLFISNSGNHHSPYTRIER